MSEAASSSASASTLPAKPTGSSDDKPATWFDGVRNFPPAKKEDGTPIPTLDFVAASEDLLGLFGLLGSGAFTIVSNDLSGNIEKIKKRYNTAPEQSQTLQALVLAERAEKKKEATEGLLWLRRGFEFLLQAIDANNKNDSEELVTSFTNSYNATLKQHHNFVVKGLIGVALKATPYRATFYQQLGLGKDDDNTLKQVKKDANEWIESLKGVVGVLEKFYADTPAATKF